jgi:HK97 family phage major capsid protein
MTDINRSTSGVLLPAAVSNEILSKVQEDSVLQRVSRRVSLPGSGVSFQQITGEPVAAWVGETAEKPVSNPTVTNKTMTPYKLAVIETFSNEFRRDKAALYEALVGRLPTSLAKKFDTTIMHGTAPGTGFSVLSGSTAIGLGTSVYDGTVTALGEIYTARRTATTALYSSTTLRPTVQSVLFLAAQYSRAVRLTKLELQTASASLATGHRQCTELLKMFRSRLAIRHH